MRKWWFPAVFLAAWVVAGFVLFGFGEPRQYRNADQAETADRIVSLAPDLTETLFALGLDEKIVAVTLDSDYPPAAESKPKVGTFWQPDIEAIIAAGPDLVISLDFVQQRELAERLRRIGCNCLTLNIETIDDFFRAVTAIGVATRQQKRAEELASHIRSSIDRIAAAATGEKVKVLWVVQREPLRVAGRRTFINEMIELSGGRNAIGPTLHKYPSIGGEQVVACRAEVIIEPMMVQTDAAGQLGQARRYWSKYENVPAVANDRIYVVDGDVVSRLGPRLPEAVETIARCLRPGRFAD